MIRDLDHEAALRGYARELEVAKAPVHYASYNEAQRDRYFGSLAAAFMGENPRLVAELVPVSTIALFWRLQSFFSDGMCSRQLLLSVRLPECSRGGAICELWDCVHSCACTRFRMYYPSSSTIDTACRSTQ